MQAGIKKILKIFVICLALLFTISSVRAGKDDDHEHDTGNEAVQEEEFVANEFILDHIKDSHEWHLWTNAHGHHVSIPLPVILFSQNSGFHIFMSSKLAHGHEYKEFRIPENGEYAGKIVAFNKAGEIAEVPLDFSVTKNVAGMLVVVIVMFIVFIRMGKMYRGKADHISKGIFGFIEILIIFIRDQVAIPNIGEEKYLRFMPYLLTVFFFILINNVFGLIPFFPFGANVTGNIAVTMVLAAFTLVITSFSGTKDYW